MANQKEFSVKLNYSDTGLLHVKKLPSTKLRAQKVNGQILIEGNKNGLLLLAKNLIGLAHTNARLLKKGFHIHIDKLYGDDIEQEFILSHKAEKHK